MTTKEILSIDLDKLLQKQHDILKENTIKVLKEITKLVEEEKYEEVKDYIIDSPGDSEFGKDNHYIDFGYHIKGDYIFQDIAQICNKLETLKEQIKKNNI
jgi:hypothetical protein